MWWCCKQMSHAALFNALFVLHARIVFYVRVKIKQFQCTQLAAFNVSIVDSLPQLYRRTRARSGTDLKAGIVAAAARGGSPVAPNTWLASCDAENNLALSDFRKHVNFFLTDFMPSRAPPMAWYWLSSFANKAKATFCTLRQLTNECDLVSKSGEKGRI